MGEGENEEEGEGEGVAPVGTWYMVHDTWHMAVLVSDGSDARTRVSSLVVSRIEKKKTRV